MTSDAADQREVCRLAHHGPGTPQWIRYQKSDASIAYAYYCFVCKGITHEVYGHGGTWVSKKRAAELSGQDPEKFPLLENGIRYTLCLRCRKTQVCHLHHIAPRAIFKDAEEWPQIPLCQRCHTLWHRAMTPGLCTAYDPDEHLAVLKKWFDEERLELLRDAITAHLEIQAL